MYMLQKRTGLREKETPPKLHLTPKYNKTKTWSFPGAKAKLKVTGFCIAPCKSSFCLFKQKERTYMFCIHRGDRELRREGGLHRILSPTKLTVRQNSFLSAFMSTCLPDCLPVFCLFTFQPSSEVHLSSPLLSFHIFPSFFLSD